MELVLKLIESRQAKQAELDALLVAPTTEARNLTDPEAASFSALTGEIKALDERIAELNDSETRKNAAGDIAKRLTPNVVVKSEPTTYRKDGGASYFADLGKAFVGQDVEARSRLSRHAQEVRDISRTDGAGGEFVPPAWLVEDYVALARAGRVTADLCNKAPLPAGTDSINVPKISTGTAVAAQTADNAAVQETDMATSSVSAPVRTIAGQQDLALQLLEQSPVAFDRIVFADLLGDYASKLDVQVLNGSNASGQVKGILGATGINTVTYTDASPTVAELYPKVADAINQSHNRLLPPDAIVMHPRRWMWILAALDSSSRPLVVPGAAHGPHNALGAGMGSDKVQGPVGSLLGLPVYLDPNVPINLGGGTNEDRIIVARFADMWLFESTVRTRALPEVLSGNLGVRLQVYGYVAFTAERYPSGISVISGTGLATPTF